MPTILLIAGAAVLAYGQYQEGKAAEQQGKAEAAWHQYNAEIARREKTAEEEATRSKVTQQRREAKAFESRQRSLIGASGVNIEGSPLLLAEDTAEQFKIQEADIITKGRRRASAFESQSILDVSKASAAKARGAAAKRAGVTRAIGTGLLGGAQAAKPTPTQTV